MNTLKSIGAVVAGFIVVAVLSTVMDMLMRITGLIPESVATTSIMLAVALAYRSVFTVLGGYTTARLAPQNPQKHVIILAVIGFIAGTLGAIAGWSLSAHWYPIALAVTGPFFVWLGGKWQQRSSQIVSI